MKDEWTIKFSDGTRKVVEAKSRTEAASRVRPRMRPGLRITQIYKEPG